jgi:hypothetical protein
MIAISPMEALVLIVLSTGGGSNDVVSFLNPEAYFKMHGIKPGVEQMTELAGKDPTEPKTQVAQLLAIRWLGSHAEEAKKSDKARALLAQIAEGKKANDPYGFARDNAQRALARIEGKPLARVTIPADSLREGVKWFPADATLVAGMDFRASGEIKPGDEDLAGMISRLAPGDAQKEFAQFADQVGNFRLDRIVVAVKADGDGQPERTFVRFTGAGNLKLWVAFLQKQIPGIKTSEVKGPKGEAITLLTGDQNTLALALIGDTDVFLTVPERNKARQRDLLEQVLEVRAGTKPSAATGSLQELLKEVPAQAFAMAVGDVPAEVGKKIAGNSPLRVAPQKFAATVSRDKAIQVGVRALMKNADEAKTLAEGLDTVKKQALEALKYPPPQQIFPPALTQMVGKILTAATVKVKDTEVIGNLTIPAEAPHEFRKVLEGLRQQGEATKPKEPSKPKE